MSNNDLLKIGELKCLILIDVLIRNEEPKTLETKDHIIIVNLLRNEGTHSVLVISRDRVEGVYILDNFAIETLPLSLQMYIDLGFLERLQQNSEIGCGAFCLYMIYLVGSGFKNKHTLNGLLLWRSKASKALRNCLGNQGCCLFSDGGHSRRPFKPSPPNILWCIISGPSERDKT